MLRDVQLLPIMCPRLCLPYARCTIRKSIGIECIIDTDPECVRKNRQPGTSIKGIIRVSKLQGIDLFYYLLDLREFSNSNDMHKSLVGALF